MTDRLYLLDTNIISDIIRNPTGKVVQHIAEIGEHRLCTSIIVASELRYGAVKKASPKILKKIDDILQEMPVLPYQIPADSDYGILRAELEAAGQPIGSNDLLIAAHALSLGMILVTNNVREFGRIHGLKVENWLR